MGAAPRPVDDRWLALLVEASADVVAVLDESAVLLYANPAAETLFGYDLDERRGESVVDLLHPDDLELALSSLDSMRTPPIASTASTCRPVSIIRSSRVSQVITALVSRA